MTGQGEMCSRTGHLLYYCRRCAQRKRRHAMRHDDIHLCKLCALASAPPVFRVTDN